MYRNSGNFPSIHSIFLISKFKVAEHFYTNKNTTKDFHQLSTGWSLRSFLENTAARSLLKDTLFFNSGREFGGVEEVARSLEAGEQPGLEPWNFCETSVLFLFFRPFWGSETPKSWMFFGWAFFWGNKKPGDDFFFCQRFFDENNPFFQPLESCGLHEFWVFLSWGIKVFLPSISSLQEKRLWVIGLKGFLSVVAIALW